MTVGRDGHSVRDRRGARAAATLALVGAAAVFAAPAAAQEPLPGDNSGTNQYIEPVPDAGGDRPAAPNPQNAPDRLPPEVRDAVPADERQTLRGIASDPGAGAPSGGASGEDGGTGGRGGAGRGSIPREDEEGAAGAVSSAVFDSDNPAPVIILMAVLGMTLAGLFVRLRRRSS
jgi:hypothetical protein